MSEPTRMLAVSETGSMNEIEMALAEPTHAKVTATRINGSNRRTLICAPSTVRASLYRTSMQVSISCADVDPQWRRAVASGRSDCAYNNLQTNAGGSSRTCSLGLGGRVAVSVLTDQRGDGAPGRLLDPVPDRLGPRVSIRPMPLRHRGRSSPPRPWGVHETGSSPLLKFVCAQQGAHTCRRRSLDRCATCRSSSRGCSASTSTTHDQRSAGKSECQPRQLDSRAASP